MEVPLDLYNTYRSSYSTSYVYGGMESTFYDSIEMPKEPPIYDEIILPQWKNYQTSIPMDVEYFKKEDPSKGPLCQTIASEPNNYVSSGFLLWTNVPVCVKLFGIVSVVFIVIAFILTYNITTSNMNNDVVNTTSSTTLQLYSFTSEHTSQKYNY
ncbi:hypothetical protein J6590_015266 [Homalodisca vitripennis]|nr:hypothetical protein J6590_015266 [Homalodisca vitripennis]